MRYTLKLKQVVLPALLLAIAVVGMQLSSCKKKNDSPTSTQVSLANVDFKDTTLLTKATAQTYEATNVPQGVSVAYTGNTQTALGDHPVTATFSLKSGYTWAATEQPDASGNVVKNIKLTISDYLTAPTTATDGSNAVAIKKAADIYTDVTIPATLFGFPVVSIDSGAFEKNTTVTSVKIPEGVTYVGKAFWGCTNLTKVDFPSTLVYIENEAFIQAPNPLEMKVVKLSPALTTIIMRAVEPPTIDRWWHYSNAGDAVNDFQVTLLGTVGWVAKVIDPTITDADNIPAGIKVYVKDDATLTNYTTGSSTHPGSWGWSKYWNKTNNWGKLADIGIN